MCSIVLFICRTSSKTVEKLAKIIIKIDVLKIILCLTEESQNNMNKCFTDARIFLRYQYQ